MALTQLLSRFVLPALLSVSMATGGATGDIFSAQGAENKDVPQLNLAAEQPSPTPQIVYVYVTPEAAAAPTKKPTTTASAKRINTGTSITRELYQGCKGDDVTLLQTWLCQKGYPVAIDGQFGQGTYDAVCRFQYNNGLKADGIAGEKTIRALAAWGVPAPTPNVIGSRTLRMGDYGPDVLQLQQRLRALGYLISATGSYDSDTYWAVYNYQLMNGLAVDGIAGPNTLYHLYSRPLPMPTATPRPTATVKPTIAPTVEPTVAPTVEPTAAPTVEPTAAPTVEPTAAPTVEPTTAPTVEPTVAPTVEPTQAPTQEPTVELVKTCLACGKQIVEGNESQHAKLECGHNACAAGKHTEKCTKCGAYRCTDEAKPCDAGGEHSWPTTE